MIVADYVTDFYHSKIKFKKLTSFLTFNHRFSFDYHTTSQTKKLLHKEFVNQLSYWNEVKKTVLYCLLVKSSLIIFTFSQKYISIYKRWVFLYFCVFYHWAKLQNTSSLISYWLLSQSFLQKARLIQPKVKFSGHSL